MWKSALHDGRLLSSEKREGAIGALKQYASRASAQASPSLNIRKRLYFRTAMVMAAVILTLYIGAWFLLGDNLSGYTIFSNLGYIAVNGMATLCLFYAASISHSFNRRIYIGWMILGIAQLSYAIGDIIFAYYNIVLNIDIPFPSFADVPYVLRYILYLIGIFILPSVHISSRERLKMMLDMAIVAIASLLFFWTLIIAPTIEQNIDADPLTLLLSVSYPVMDLMLIFALIDLLLRRLNNPSQNAIILLAASTFFLVFSDTIYNRQLLDGTYVSGGLVDIGWPVAYILIGLAGVSQADSLKSDILQPNWKFEGRYGQLTWPLYLPYIAAGGAFVLLIWSHDHPLALSFSTLAWPVGGIIGLVITRQVLALDENTQLYSEAQAEIAERKLAEDEVKRLNEELEHRVAERTSELWATNIELQREIAERKQAETALAESQRRLSDIINFLPDATFVIDSEGRVIAWNHAIEAMTGIKAETILGKGDYEYALPFYGEKRPILIDLVFNLDQESKKRYVNLKRLDNGAFVGETKLLSLKGREAYLLASAAPLYDSDGNISGAIESIRDITENKRAEENLQRSKEAAEAATRAKSAFLANMSHEIRTPMNAVIGMTGLLLETRMTQEQRDYVETIRASGDALLAVINDILDYSKIDGGKMELENLPFDLRACVEDSLDLVASAAAKKGLELAYVMQEVPGTLVGDVTRLRQILVNLLGNAVKFTETGEVVLAVDIAFADKEKAELHFTVKDTGIGISKNAMSKLFKSFSQVDSSTTRQYGGTGLGLAISSRLVEMMGGRIWAESEPGMGSTFHFTVVSRLVEPEKPLEGETSSGLEGKLILIVDDNETARNILAQTVRTWGMEPTTAASGQEALNILQNKETFEVALLDAVMPEMNGLDLAREIEKITTAKPLVVVISPIGSNNVKEHSVSGWLTKPVRPLQLRDLMVKLLSPNTALKATPVVQMAEESPVKNHNLRILLAEDNLVNQKVALSMMKRLGYTADVVANGIEALQALERQQYDVVLMDVQMPEMDGLEATRRIRSLQIKTWIIAMTAYALKGDREECLDVGMDEYIAKPIKIDELQRALDRRSKIIDESLHNC